MQEGHRKTPIFAYNTNGFYHHRLEDALRILAELGYGGVALTPDVHHLDPFRSGPAEVTALARLLDFLDLEVVVETGARFILDARRKHHPSLLTPGRAAERRALLERCMDLAAGLGARLLSLHSGAAPPGMPRAESMKTLAVHVAALVRYGAARGVPLALEPEPGMFIESMADFQELCAHPRLEGAAPYLTLDVGHAHITEEASVVEVIRGHRDRMRNVHLDDARGGRHEHLPLGEGEIPFAAVMEALLEAPAPPFVSVELSRHGHEAPARAESSLAFLRALRDGGRGTPGRP